MPKGLQPHDHAGRAAVVERLVPLFRQKFGDNLLAIAADASFARGQDREYSDLEMVVFLREPVAEGEDGYLQRIVDGMLIEVIYYTVEQFLEQRSKVQDDWPMAASDVLLPVYNAPAVEEIVQRLAALKFPRQDFLRAAERRFIQVQEAFSKVLNAVEQGNAEGISLLLFDAALHLLVALSLLNEKPFTTFSRYIAEARAFPLLPEGFEDLMNLIVYGEYQDLQRVREVSLRVYESMEDLFAREGCSLYDESIDPNLPNKKYA